MIHAKMWVGLGLLAAGLPGYASAGLLEFSGSPDRMMESGEVTVPLYAQAKAADPSGKGFVKLERSGAGMRIRKFALLKIGVYFIASYVENVAALRAAVGPMEGLSKSKVRALQLTFLTDIAANKMKESLEDAMKLNGVDIKNLDIRLLLEKLSVDLRKNQKITLVGYSGTEKERVELEVNGQRSTVTGNGVVRALWSVWFGKSLDNSLDRLKTELWGNT